MAENQHSRNSHRYGQSSYLHRIRLRAFLLIIFERLWPLILPFLLLCAAFTTISWFGLFPYMPRWLHITVIAFFTISGLAALCLPVALRIPEEAEVDAYIERQNNLLHAPLQVQKEQLINPDNDPFAQALWQEHQRRMNETIAQLHLGLPHPDIPRRDPLALRSIVVLLFVISFAYASGNSGGRIEQAFMISPKANALPLRLDAWITPPDYTGKAPIYLSKLQTPSEQQKITVPQNSVVAIQIIGGQSVKLTSQDKSGSAKLISPEAPDTAATTNRKTANKSDAVNFQHTLTNEQSLKLDTGGESYNWSFAVTPDTPPKIEFKGNPVQAANGTLTLSYELEDDYGIANAYVEIKPEAEEDHEIFPLYEAPEMLLSLPKSNAGQAKTTKDLTTHPWAGNRIRMTLIALDHAGQRGTSSTKTLILPERPFSNPLAKAVIEQRRLLAMDAMQRDHILDMLNAVMLRPADTIKNAAHFLGLQTIRTRLEIAMSDDQLRDTVAYMWDVARGIEDGNLSAAEQRLRQAQEALKQAIERGAGQEEIAALSQELRDAMQAFMREMAQRQQKSPSQNGPLPPNTKMLSEKDLQRMLEQIENLARQGSRAEAQQLLAELENIMNNLQMGQSQAQGQGQGKGEGNQQGPAGQMQQQMNKLGDIMRRQQQLMNETFNLDQKMMNQFNNGSGWPDAGQSNETTELPDENTTDVPEDSQSFTQPEFTDSMRALQDQQKNLKSELQKLSEELDSMGLAPAKEFSDAEDFMTRADEALNQLNGGSATNMQGEALDAMRRGSREMMKKMQQALDEQNGGTQSQADQQGRDPLGRMQGSSGPDFGSDVELPAEIDIQRAREVLDEIRRRLGNALSPQQEKEYLERLLKFD